MESIKRGLQMKTKLILIEGIPGSGKSTLAQNVSTYLTEHKIKNRLYQEGKLHPANLDGYAVMKEEELNQLYRQFPEKRMLIQKHMKQLEGQYLIEKQMDSGEDKQLCCYLQNYAVWDRGLSIERFLQLELASWQAFVQQASGEEDTIIFECAFLQDHITELMLFYDCSIEELISYFQKLVQIILPMHPYLIYLQQENVEETLHRVALERVDEDGNQVWANGVAGFITESPYGKKYHLSGYGGLVEFYRRRKEIDRKVLDQITIPYVLVDNNTYDWEAMSQKVMCKMEELRMDKMTSKMQGIMPERLQKNDVIGIASPSHIAKKKNMPCFLKI